MGLFALDGAFAQVNREAVLLLGGPRALLMQLAHPLVAAGVGDHSRFEQDPLGRLRRTLDRMLQLIFGEESEALASARRVNAVHARVHGRLREGTARYPAGTPYDARDPALALWVHATLVDSALVTYESLVGRLAPARRESFYQESKRIARLLQLPETRLPADAADFEAYVTGMLEGDELEITPTAARLADAVLHPPLPGLPRFVGDLGSAVSLALLPQSLRRRYGLAWSPPRRAGWQLAQGGIRLALPLLPALLREMPHARRAQRRKDFSHDGRKFPGPGEGAPRDHR